jgi:hypothetical protein
VMSDRGSLGVTGAPWWRHGDRVQRLKNGVRASVVVALHARARSRRAARGLARTQRGTAARGNRDGALAADDDYRVEREGLTCRGRVTVTECLKIPASTTRRAANFVALATVVLRRYWIRDQLTPLRDIRRAVARSWRDRDFQGNELHTVCCIT